jgi:hypothetical protein
MNEEFLSEYADKIKNQQEFQGAMGVLKTGIKVYVNGAYEDVDKPIQIKVLSVDYENAQIKFIDHPKWNSGWIAKAELRKGFERDVEAPTK